MHATIWKLDKAVRATLLKAPEQCTATEQFIANQWSKDTHPEWYEVDCKDHHQALRKWAYINVAPNYTKLVDDWYVYYSRDISAHYIGLWRESNGRPHISVLEGLIVALHIADPNTPERMAHRIAILDRLAMIMQSTKKYEAKVKSHKLTIIETFEVMLYVGKLPPTEKELVNHLASCSIQSWDVQLMF